MGPIFYISHIEQWRFTSLFARPTMPFSPLEYGIEVWCVIPISWWKYDSKSLTNCDPKSVMSSSGALKRHICRHDASAAAFAATSCLGNNSTYSVKVSMITIIYFSPMSEGKGSIVSIEVLSIDFRVDSTNRDACMVLCLVSIYWHVGQLCINCLSSCRKCGQSVPLVSSGVCCVISANVRSTPLSVHGGMYGTVVLRFVVPRSTVVRGRDYVRRVMVELSTG